MSLKNFEKAFLWVKRVSKNLEIGSSDRKLKRATIFIRFKKYNLEKFPRKIKKGVSVHIQSNYLNFKDIPFKYLQSQVLRQCVITDDT